VFALTTQKLDAYNLKLLCRGHNGFFADKDFGAAHMLMKRASPRTHGDQRVLWDG
jgi:hypothetical protein